MAIRRTSRPLSNEEIVAKWRDNATMTFNGGRVAELEAVVLGLEEAPSALAAFRRFATV